MAPGFILQIFFHPHSPGSSPSEVGGVVRYGLTASRKVGGAVVRNRARRRLRAVAEEILPSCSLPPCDIVLIARQGGTVGRDFAALKADLLWSIGKVRLKNTA